MSSTRKRRKHPWPLLAAVVLLAVLTLVALVAARSALGAAETDRGAVIFAALASVSINVVLIAGLVACKSWARWLTIIRLAAGAIWSLYELSEAARRAGGAAYLPASAATGVYATVALAVAIVILLLFPSVSDAVEGRRMAGED